MAPLAEYPQKPSKGEENGYEKLEAYDRVVEGNIEEAHRIAEGSVQTDNPRLPIQITREDFEALDPPVPGQAYYILRS